jgi:hypothetical protein
MLCWVDYVARWGWWWCNHADKIRSMMVWLVMVWACGSSFVVVMCAVLLLAKMRAVGNGCVCRENVVLWLSVVMVCV